MQFTTKQARTFDKDKGTMHSAVVFVLQEMNGKSFNARYPIHSAVSNIICSLLFGERYEYDDPEFQELIDVLDEIFEFLVTNVMVSWHAHAQ